MLSLAIVILAVSGPVHAEEGELPAMTAPHEALQHWLDACRGVSSVRGNVCIFRYNHTWHKQSRSTGQFGYRSGSHGFIRAVSDEELSDRAYKRYRGTPYSFEQKPVDHFRWFEDHVLLIDEEHQMIVEFPITLIDADGTLFAGLKSMDHIYPFLPGILNQRGIDQFSFKVTRETPNEIYLRATPNPESHFRRNCDSFDLILKKDPWRLYAVRCTGIDYETVLVFSDVEFDPPLWDEPDLSGYRSDTSPNKGENRNAGDE
ncbi:MAG: hypothetical protein WEB58_21905 [Planctomycetaceae bacterium]